MNLKLMLNYKSIVHFMYDYHRLFDMYMTVFFRIV